MRVCVVSLPHAAPAVLGWQVRRTGRQAVEGSGGHAWVCGKGSRPSNEVDWAARREARPDKTTDSTTTD